MRRRVAALVAAVVVVGLGGCTEDKSPVPTISLTPVRDFAPGAAGIGDAYFPTYGNGGYDVAGYDLSCGMTLRVAG